MRSHKFAASFIVLVVLVSMLSWAGKQPWLETKPYTEWTEKDVRAILTESPWVASQTFMIYSRDDNPASREWNAQGAQGVAAGGNVGGSDRIGQVRTTADSPLDHQVYVSVSWASSLTLRQATVRMTQRHQTRP